MTFSCKPANVATMQTTGGEPVILDYQAGSVTLRRNTAGGASDVQDELSALQEVQYGVHGLPSSNASLTFKAVAKVNLKGAKFTTKNRQCQATGNYGILSALCTALPTGLQSQSPNLQNQPTATTPVTSDDFAVVAQYGSQQTVDGVTYQEFWLSLNPRSDGGRVRILTVTQVEFRTHPTFAKLGQEVITATQSEGLRTPRLATHSTAWTTKGTTVKFSDGSSLELPGTPVAWSKPRP